MLKSQEHSVKLSELRSELNVLAGKDDLSEKELERSAELRAELQKLEERYRAAVTLESKPEERTVDGGEGSEFRKLLDGARLVDFFGAVTGKALDGESRELAEHMSLGIGEFPVELLRAPVEKRAATTAPTEGPVTRMPTQDYVFPRSGAAHLGIAQPVIAEGSALYPRISTKAVGYHVAAGGAVTQSEATFTGAEITPSRLQSAIYFRREDAARFPNFEQDLRAHLRRVLAHQMDNVILNAATIGLLAALTKVASGPDAFTYEIHVSRLALDRIDGRYAAEQSDLRLLLGADTFAHAGKTKNTTYGGESALEYLTRMSGGVQVSANLPAKASSKQRNIVARGTEHRGAVFPIWRAGEILMDPYSRSDKGEVQLTAALLGNFKVLDTDAFSSVETNIG